MAPDKMHGQHVRVKAFLSSGNAKANLLLEHSTTLGHLRMLLDEVNHGASTIRLVSTSGKLYDADLDEHLIYALFETSSLADVKRSCRCEEVVPM